MMPCCPNREQVAADDGVSVDMVLSITVAPNVYQRFHWSWLVRAASYSLASPMSDSVLKDYLSPTQVCV